MTVQKLMDILEKVQNKNLTVRIAKEDELDSNTDSIKVIEICSSSDDDIKPGLYITEPY